MMNKTLIPAFLRGDNVLVPLKIDLTYKGARFVDTFCWDLYTPVVELEEFVARTCADLNFPPGFQQRITMQIQEQLDAYRDLIKLIHRYAAIVPNWNDKVSQTQSITIGVRHGTIDFSDKVDWDPMSNFVTPEEFASITCGDLGLPTEIEPAIAHKIRESLFRWVNTIIHNPNSNDTNIQAEFKVPDTKATLVQGNQAVDMVTNLWKRAKPNTLDEIASVPQPQLPQDKEGNYNIWLPPRSGGASSTATTNPVANMTVSSNIPVPTTGGTLSASSSMSNLAGGNAHSMGPTINTLIPQNIQSVYIPTTGNPNGMHPMNNTNNHSHLQGVNPLVGNNNLMYRPQ